MTTAGRRARRAAGEGRARPALRLVQLRRVGARSDSDRPAVFARRRSRDRRASSRRGWRSAAWPRSWPRSRPCAACSVPSPRGSCAGSIRPRDGSALRPLVHRWTRGDDFVALLWILRELLEESRIARAGVRRRPRSGRGRRRRRPRAVLRAGPARRSAAGLSARVPARPGVCYFFSRPSTGSACKRLNLFLRWMVRQDGVDPGGWTTVPARQLVVPLDTHTIRVGRCLRLTRRTSPGWKMAADITSALADARPRRSGPLRLRALPPQHDGRVRVRDAAGTRALSARRRVSTRAGRGSRARSSGTARGRRRACARPSARR